MNPVEKSALIIVDNREEKSGIPMLLKQGGMDVRIQSLKAGDYIINGEIVAERKSAVDFVQSLISGRLFNQCARLVQIGLRPILLLEGDPYRTAHVIDSRAVKGAILSVTTAWQIPVVYTDDTQDSASTLIMLAGQSIPGNRFLRSHNYKPKKQKNHRLRFLQGLPNTGAIMAGRLYDHFGSVEAVIRAETNALMEVDGLGKKTAEKIRAFVS
ncbi:MAG: hypothetical protein GVY19_00060 [Bacteroidetes bacterium]|jgi:Fanconi anemia group M protein|nr:hypothetical protein [Bacteroidota bacterium]